MTDTQAESCKRRVGSASVTLLQPQNIGTLKESVLSASQPLDGDSKLEDREAIAAHADSHVSEVGFALHAQRTTKAWKLEWNEEQTHSPPAPLFTARLAAVCPESEC